MITLPYGELIAAVMGALSSLLLAIPLWHEIRVSKRFVKLLNQIEKGGDPSTLENIRQQFLNDKMKAYTQFEPYAFLGFLLLFLSFVLTSTIAIEHLILSKE